ncbi:MAG: ribonuclease H-like domain-containing protein [Patescibacteria group bacterium]|nr:ribonuclease H-like domain-containing protein [Patescibacteria group bacterium]
MILYVDGGCSNSNQKNQAIRKMVMVVTDESGNVLVEKTQEEGSNNIAELLAIKEALMWISVNKVDNVLIKTDSKIALTWIHSKKLGKHLNNRELTTTIRDIIRALMKGILVSFVWIPREESLAGHYIEGIEGRYSL